MGWFPADRTEADWKEHDRKCDEARKARERIVQMLRAKGLTPIPKEKYRQYCIGLGRECPKCARPKHDGIGCFTAGGEWWDWDEVQKLVYEALGLPQSPEN